MKSSFPTASLAFVAALMCGVRRGSASSLAEMANWHGWAPVARSSSLMFPPSTNLIPAPARSSWFLIRTSINILRFSTRCATAPLDSPGAAYRILMPPAVLPVRRTVTDRYNPGVSRSNPRQFQTRAALSCAGFFVYALHCEAQDPQTRPNIHCRGGDWRRLPVAGTAPGFFRAVGGLYL